MPTLTLPLPALAEGRSASLPYLTDDALFEACGVRIAFTGRAGGVSVVPYASLNLGSHVGDDLEAVAENRRRVAECCMGSRDIPVVVPNQVHGDTVLVLDGPLGSTAEGIAAFAEEAAEGADALVVTVPDVAALLCFADCVPMIAVRPDGAFAVIHAGWRGVYARIAQKAALVLAGAPAAWSAALPGQADSHGKDEALRKPEAPACGACALSDMNFYIGPHICASCFETGADVQEMFEKEFGPETVRGGRTIDLERALRVQLEEAGADPARIASSGRCTQCEPDRYFSYRASGGTCGRHGAFACRASSAL